MGTVARELIDQIEHIQLARNVLDAPTEAQRVELYRLLVERCGTELAANHILTPLVAARQLDPEPAL